MARRRSVWLIVLYMLLAIAGAMLLVFVIIPLLGRLLLWIFVGLYVLGGAFGLWE